MNIPLIQTQSYIKEKGSKFYGLVFPINTKEDIDIFLKETCQNFPKATHYCYAWALGENREEYRINDDGEPSGSAGLPIFNQIRSKECTQILVVVVRYYGGSKLGVAGLISSYGNAALEALKLNQFTVYKEMITAEIECDYAQENIVRNYLKNSHAMLLSQENDMKVHLNFIMEKFYWETFYEAHKNSQIFKLNLL